MRRTALIALALLLSTPAFATGEIESLITDADRARLEAYETTRDAAVAEAREGGSPEDIAIMDRALSAPHQSFEGFDMTGDWQCRTTKVGGLANLVVYSWFRCKVTDDGSGWKLEKLSGSQRTTGRFFTDSDTRLTYLGSGSIHDAKPAAYGSGPESDQAGYAFRTGEAEWHIEFPAPHYESKLDILEFRR
ncbi:MAG: DUF4893 domain-containing protein [Mesorhizobium sp.]|uniref:DUF4893 domain-containing protein n=1 Tax=Neoaquamicrobium sediminum TaxID=1849104 RepID=UPI001E135A4B|nr:DUF4893 domain-containing protein [Mesorhizobium sp.]